MGKPGKRVKPRHFTPHAYPPLLTPPTKITSIYPQYMVIKNNALIFLITVMEKLTKVPN